MTDRNREIETFLAAIGWRGAHRRPLAGDASFRRYERVEKNGLHGVLMDAPPPQEDIRPFVRITRHLLSLGYSAPGIRAEDPEHGFILLEDLGDATYTKALAAGADEAELYRAAVDLLIDLHRKPAEVAIPSGLPPYDDARLRDEALLFTDWYLPRVLEDGIDTTARGAFIAIWQDLFPVLRDQPQTIVLRDFHADNLIWLPDRAGVASCGVLDYQDAVAGPTAYDVMSLLEDARRDFRPGLVDDLVAYYCAAFPDRDAAAFNTSYAILGAQRHCKVIGIFTRLAYRDGKDGYLGHIPRVWRLLENSCRHPALAPLREWLDRTVPPENRVLPHKTLPGDKANERQKA